MFDNKWSLNLWPVRLFQWIESMVLGFSAQFSFIREIFQRDDVTSIYSTYILMVGCNTCRCPVICFPIHSSILLPFSEEWTSHSFAIAFIVIVVVVVVVAVAVVVVDDASGKHIISIAYYLEMCYSIIPTVTCNHFEVLKPSYWTLDKLVIASVICCVLYMNLFMHKIKSCVISLERAGTCVLHRIQQQEHQHPIYGTIFAWLSSFWYVSFKNYWFVVFE